MGFEPKTEAELTQTMIDVASGNTTKITDYTVGSKIRTIFEACASLVATLYHNTAKGLKDAVENAIYTAFNFPADPGRRATTNVTFARSAPATQDYLIPAGTLVAAGDLVFSTNATVTLTSGTTSITATATATAVGAKFNVQAGQINVLKVKPVGVDTVTNPDSVIDGKDAETREQRQKRFQDYVTGFSRGTPAALRDASLKVPGVVAAEVVENPALTVLVSGSGSYQNISDECNLPFGSAVALAPTTIGEATYVGAVDKFPMLWIQLLQVGIGGNGVWEYWNGSAWVTLTATDNTNKLTATGALTFTPPADWLASKVNSVFCFWVRFRLTGTFSTMPTTYHIFAAPPPGWVDLYVQDIHAQASTDLKNNVVTALETYRGHGVTINVKAPTIRTVNVTANVVVADGFDKAQTTLDLAAGINAYLNAFVLGENLYEGMLRSEIARVSRGAIENVTLTTPTTDIFASSGEIIRAGVVTVLVTN
jgi:uncharacterized phage protein gp47/JayE